MEPVCFCATANRLSIQIAPERRGFDKDGSVQVLPARIVCFEGGRFFTSDPQVIEALRGSQAYRDRKIFEITAADRAAVRGTPPPQRVVRGTIGAEQITSEAGIDKAPGEDPFRVEERAAGPACPVCHKTFPDDPQGRKLRMHVVSHRASVAPKPAGAEEAPAKE